MRWRANTKSVTGRAPPTSVVILIEIRVAILAKSNFVDASAVDEGIETKDIRRSVTCVHCGDVKDEALTRVVEDGTKDWGVWNDQVLAASEVMDLACGAGWRFGTF